MFAQTTPPRFRLLSSLAIDRLDYRLVQLGTRYSKLGQSNIYFKPEAVMSQFMVLEGRHPSAGSCCLLAFSFCLILIGLAAPESAKSIKTCLAKAGD